MYKKKNILTTAFFTALLASGIFFNACAEEIPTAENQINTEETQIPQAPKKPKKDSTPKKEKPKKADKNSSQNSQQKSENENTKSAEPQEKNENKTEQEPPQQKEEKSLDLPNINNSEVQLKPYFSQISQNTEGKSILKTLISWALILAGIILILKVVLSNRKIPKSYTFNKKSKHSIIPQKGKPNKYRL
ncbi:MAG: hypothetical protein IJI84_00435 [Clostridia bacterium]|nr:hypothetical protein [Clostridia bacterium]